MQKGIEKTNKWIFIAIKVFVLAFFAVAVGLIIAFVLTSTIPIKENNKKNYLQTDGKKSEFVLFPKSIEEYMNVLEYHYYDYKLLDGEEVVLIVEYSPEDFNKEIDRLNNISYTTFMYKQEKKLKFDDAKLFNFKTYVAEYNHSGRFEYACIDSDSNRITYIYLRSMSNEKFGLDNAYLPKEYVYGPNDKHEEFKYYFSIYVDGTEDKWVE